VRQSQAGPFAFICFGCEDFADREYGPKCAEKAVEVMNGKQIGEFSLYVRPALKKSEREKELQHEALKYRNSKRRCNLYVKNIAPDVTEQELI
jgi:RNA recognition motif-containing protein